MNATLNTSQASAGKTPGINDVTPLWLKILLPAGLVVILVAGILFYDAERRDHQLATVKNLEAVANLKAREIAEWRVGELEEGVKLSDSPFFSEAVARWLAQPQPELTGQLLKKFSSLCLHPGYSDVALVDLEGKVRLSVSGRLGPLNQNMEQALAAAMRERKPAMADLHVGDDSRTYLGVVAPMFPNGGTDGQPICAILLKCDAEEFLFPLLDSWPVPSQTEETVLVRRESGDVLILNATRKQPDSAMKLRYPLTETNRPVVMAALGRRGTVQGLDYRGEKVLAVITAIPNSPWIMVAKVDAAEINQVWHSESAVILELLVFAIIAMCSVWLLGWQRSEKLHYQKLYQSETALRLSEEKFATAFANNPVAIALTRLEDGLFLDVNDTWLKLLGYRREEVIGRSSRGMGIWPSQEAADRFVATLRAEGALRNCEQEFHKKGGEIFTAQISTQVLNLRGEPVILSTLLDISDRKQAEQVLREEEAFRRKIIEQAAEGLCVAHMVPDFPHLQFNVWNRRMTEITGCTLPEINQRGWFETLFPDPVVRQAAIDRLWLLRQGQDMVAEEMEITRADGRKRTVAITTTLLSSDSNAHKPVDILAFLTDITDRKMAESQLIKLSHAVEQSPVSIVITDTAGKIEYVNPTFTEITGYTQTETLGKNPRILKSGKMPDGIYRQLWQTISSGGVWHGELCNRNKKGELYWEAVAISPVLDTAGRTTNFIAVKEDITQRKRVEEQLRQQAALLDAANDAIVVLTLDDRVTYWNRGAERIYGWSCEEAVDRKSDELCPALDDLRQRALEELLKTGSWSGELRKRNKAGKELLAFCRWTLLRDDAGNPRKILAISTDITERKQLEASFLRAQRMEGIGALAGGIAHDLNNILAPILMCGPLLRETTTNPENLKILDTIETCAQRGADIIKQLLTFARGKPGAHVPLPLRHLLNEMDKLIRETFPRNIQAGITAPKDLWSVLGDPTQIHQALMNLCVNARDAMPDGGRLSLAAANVTLTPEQVAASPESKPGDYVCVSVTDTGLGIAPEHLERIFDPFFTTKEIGKGTGLGLPTVLGIVRGHGGFVRVRSQMGSGTTFEIYLPASPVLPDAAPAQGKSNQLPPGAGELILVVDDESDVRNMVKLVLEKNGYRVTTAAEGSEGLAVFKQRRAEIKAVITDMMMPGMDGPTLVQELRRLDPVLPVFGMTGLAERAGVKGLDSIALTAMLTKPFAADDLLRAFKTALSAGVK